VLSIFSLYRDAETGERLFEKTLKASQQWGNDENMMYVVGATKADMLTDIRQIVPVIFCSFRAWVLRVKSEKWLNMA
jgi:hypothetical protein